ncbi:hypothetical protein NDU88_002252 [Pleurodeles waltl]|uniref:Uncharacterized protein n=1 Tax=Pleurodeles waltl TaxID=8319 RepID=A0AAV7VC04_PLEWA|nr:hypothetical protein NDU88_002252 [Pleurodeles waltl]
MRACSGAGRGAGPCAWRSSRSATLQPHCTVSSSAASEHLLSGARRRHRYILPRVPSAPHLRRTHGKAPLSGSGSPPDTDFSEVYVPCPCAHLQLHPLRRCLKSLPVPQPLGLDLFVDSVLCELRGFPRPLVSGDGLVGSRAGASPGLVVAVPTAELVSARRQLPCRPHSFHCAAARDEGRTREPRVR